MYVNTYLSDNCLFCTFIYSFIYSIGEICYITCKQLVMRWCMHTWIWWPDMKIVSISTYIFYFICEGNIAKDYISGSSFHLLVVICHFVNWQWFVDNVFKIVSPKWFALFSKMKIIFSFFKVIFKDIWRAKEQINNIIVFNLCFI